MGARKKIIIVDDDRETREMLKMALELEGYEVAQAANGLRLISTLHVDRPDLILLDVMMSWIDGFELCRAVKKNDEFRDIPVIFISAKKTANDIRTGLASGAADYFSKPIDMERLLARRAAGACGRRRPWPAAREAAHRSARRRARARQCAGPPAPRAVQRGGRRFVLHFPEAGPAGARLRVAGRLVRGAGQAAVRGSARGSRQGRRRARSGRPRARCRRN